MRGCVVVVGVVVCAPTGLVLPHADEEGKVAASLGVGESEVGGGVCAGATAGFPCDCDCCAVVAEGEGHTRAAAAGGVEEEGPTATPDAAAAAAWG